MLAAPDAQHLVALLAGPQKEDMAAPPAAVLPARSATRSPAPTHPSLARARAADPRCCRAAPVGAARIRRHTPPHAGARLRTQSRGLSHGECGVRRAGLARSASAPGSDPPTHTC